MVVAAAAVAAVRAVPAVVVHRVALPETMTEGMNEATTEVTNVIMIATRAETTSHTAGEFFTLFR